jgi:hypothetical protein
VFIPFSPGENTYQLHHTANAQQEKKARYKSFSGVEYAAHVDVKLITGGKRSVGTQKANEPNKT